jgi:hypothetical protein
MADWPMAGQSRGGKAALHWPKGCFYLSRSHSTHRRLTVRKTALTLVFAALTAVAACQKTGENEFEVQTPDVDVKTDTTKIKTPDVDIVKDTATVVVPKVQVKKP